VCILTSWVVGSELYFKAGASLDKCRVSVLSMQGHEEADIDPWEDPSFDIYHTTDRYGFIQYVTHFTLLLNLYDISLVCKSNFCYVSLRITLCCCLDFVKFSCLCWMSVMHMVMLIRTCPSRPRQQLDRQVAKANVNNQQQYYY